MARGQKRHVRWAATQGELVFEQAVFLPSPCPPPLARFVNPRPGPDLAARIHDGDLITKSGFFDHPTACMQATVGKISHTYKNVSKLNKWVTLKTLCPSGKNGSQRKYVAQLEKWITLINKGHTWSPLKNVSHLKEWVILKKCVTVGKWVTLKKMCHT